MKTVLNLKMFDFAICFLPLCRCERIDERLLLPAFRFFWEERTSIAKALAEIKLEHFLD